MYTSTRYKSGSGSLEDDLTDQKAAPSYYVDRSSSSHPSQYHPPHELLPDQPGKRLVIWSAVMLGGKGDEDEKDGLMSTLGGKLHNKKEKLQHR
jgi:hypothetical protein